MALLNINLAPYQLNGLVSKDTFLMHYEASDGSGVEYQVSEFFPQYMVNRSDDGNVTPSERFVSEFALTLEKFTKYCQTIRGFGNVAFNPITDITEQNNTCYMVRRKCEIPALATYMSGNRMDFYEAYLFMRPLLLFLSQAAHDEILFTFSLADIHVNRYGQIILDKTFSMDVSFEKSLADIMAVYYFLTVGKAYDPAEPSPKAHGVTMPAKLEGMMTGVLAGESAFGGMDDFCKSFKFLADRGSGGRAGSASGDGGAGPVLKWVAAGLGLVIVAAVALLIFFVLIPGYRSVRPDLEDPSLIATTAPAPTAASGGRSNRDFSALAPTDPADVTDVLEGAFLRVNDELFFRSYNDGYGLARRNALGAESVLWSGSRPAFITEKDGYVYFSDGENANKILRVDAADGKGEIFSESCALYLCVNGDYLYYTNHDDRDRMYRKHILTLEEAPYISAASYETVTDGEKLYFINGDREFNVYAAAPGPDGPALTRLNSENSRNLVYSDGMLLYTAEDGSVRAMTTDGRQTEVNCDVKASTLESDGPWLVMTEEATNRVKAYNLDTGAGLSPGGTREAAYAWTGDGEIYAVNRDDCRTVSRYTLPEE